MEIAVTGRNVEVPEHYREHVAEKLEKAVRLDRKIVRTEVELQHEPNPRQQDHCQRVEITCRSRGPVVRAEAAAADFYSALDEAVDRLTTRLRRLADRRRVHRPRRGPASVAEASADLPPAPRSAVGEQSAADGTVDGERPAGARVPAGSGAGRATPAVDGGAPVTGVSDPATGRGDGGSVGGDGPAGSPDHQPWRIVREKAHPGEPITVDDALFQMELLGHDFYLFQDKETGRPSVVYRRRAYDYGVIALAEADDPGDT